MLFQSLKNKLFEYFYFNKQERNGVFILFLILLIVVFIRLILPSLYEKENQITVIELKAPSEEITSKYQQQQQKNYSINNEFQKQLFVFDPNTITEQEAVLLGFKPKTAQTLLKFRAKGGKFKEPEDLKKVFGVSDKLYSILEPYILITSKQIKSEKVDSVKFPVVKSKELLELNSADSLGLVYLRGVGPGFSNRILKYRKKLGGFHSMIQLKEVFGMTDSLYNLVSEQIVLNPGSIRKIYINAIDFYTLRQHPYFSYQVSNIIINYRLKHGLITENVLRELGVFSEEKLKLILPYIEY
jgi:DNA uptake protein ComE-like DNA-binding protein